MRQGPQGGCSTQYTSMTGIGRPPKPTREGTRKGEELLARMATLHFYTTILQTIALPARLFRDLFDYRLGNRLYASKAEWFEYGVRTLPGIICFHRTGRKQDNDDRSQRAETRRVS